MIVLVNTEHIVYCLVVCNGTNNYVNYFWADIWKVLEKEEIRMNTFQSLCGQHATNQKNGEGLSGNTI